MAKPGEQFPKESPAAYEAFRVYIEQGADRSTAKVAQALGKSKSLIDRWSSRWSWVVRAQEWDKAQIEKREKTADEVYREQYQERLRKLTEDSERSAQALQGIATRAISVVLARIQAMEKDGVIEPKVAPLMRAAAQVAETATGIRADALGVSELLESMVENGQS